MKKAINAILLISACGLIALAAPCLRFDDDCPCHAPAVVAGSVFGCGGTGGSDETKTIADPENIENDIDKSSIMPNGEPKVTFVEIGSVNCIPCKMMQPVMKAVEDSFPGQVKIVFHDVWTPQGKTDAMKYNIRIIPTQVFLDSSGKEYFRHEGFFSKEEVFQVLAMKGVK